MRKTGAVVFAIAALATLGACSGSDGNPGGGGTPGPHGSKAQLQKLRNFAHRCESAATPDKLGVIDYPRHVSARMDKSSTYNVAIDIRSNPLPAKRVIDDPAAKSAPITVECVVGARLTTSDDVGVKSLDPTVDGWNYQQFDANGVVGWSWSITPHAPDDATLVLEIRPAAKGSVGDILATSSAKYHTPVSVSATRIQRFYSWMKSNKGLIIYIIVGLGAIVLALTKFATQLRDLIKRLQDLFKRKQPESDDSQDKPKPAPKKRPRKRVSKRKVTPKKKP